MDGEPNPLPLVRFVPSPPPKPELLLKFEPPKEDVAGAPKPDWVVDPKPPALLPPNPFAGALVPKPPPVLLLPNPVLAPPRAPPPKELVAPLDELPPQPPVDPDPKEDLAPKPPKLMGQTEVQPSLHSNLTSKQFSNLEIEKRSDPRSKAKALPRGIGS